MEEHEEALVLSDIPQGTILTFLGLLFILYSSPPLIRTPFLSDDFDLIREVSFLEREQKLGGTNNKHKLM